MKKNLFRAALIALAITAAPAANAQNNNGGNLLGGLLGAIAGQTSNETAGVVGDILGNILGTSTVSEKSIVGTWSYSQPSVAFESQNVLSQLGGSYASNKIQKKLKKGLEKSGIKPGKCSITFNSDKSFIFTVGGKAQHGTYTISGSNINLTFALSGKTVTANIKQVGNAMQIAMKADRMLQLVSTIATKASAYSSQMGTVAALLSSYSGMYLGMEFAR